MPKSNSPEKLKGQIEDEFWFAENTDGQESDSHREKMTSLIERLEDEHELIAYVDSGMIKYKQL